MSEENYLKILVKNNGELLVDCHVDAETNISLMADMLYLLTSGKLNSHVVKGLAEYGLKTEQAVLIETLLLTWQELATKEEPLISPLEVFKTYEKE